MFGYCVWFELLQNHSFFSLNKTLNRVIGSQIHNPHITADYNILKHNGIKNLKCYQPTTFYKKGNVYQDNIVNFYALQQDYVNENDNEKVFHVSIAYKANEGFTEKDIEYANSLNIPKIIRPEEINVTLWNCDSIYTKDWYKVK
jgi:hypothetical protein